MPHKLHVYHWYACKDQLFYTSLNIVLIVCWPEHARTWPFMRLLTNQCHEPFSLYNTSPHVWGSITNLNMLKFHVHSLIYRCVCVIFTVVARLPTPQYSTHPCNQPPGAPPYFQVGAVTPLHSIFFFFFFMSGRWGSQKLVRMFSKARPLPSLNTNHCSKLLECCFRQALCEHVGGILTCCYISCIYCTPLNLPSNPVVPHTNVFGAGRHMYALYIDEGTSVVCV